MAQLIRYLNTDLDVSARRDLRPVADCFRSNGVPPLSVVQGDDGLWHATFETSQRFSEPEPNIKAMVDVVETLSGPLLEIWNGCVRREFNMGFDCGDEPWAFTQGLSTELLRRIASLGASLRLTIYPERE